MSGIRHMVDAVATALRFVDDLPGLLAVLPRPDADEPT